MSSSLTSGPPGPSLAASCDKAAGAEPPKPTSLRAFLEEVAQKAEKKVVVSIWEEIEL